MAILVVDSGATSCKWSVVSKTEIKKINTVGLSPYFLSNIDILTIIQSKICKKIKEPISHIYFYGTGMGNKTNVATIKNILQSAFGNIFIAIETDLQAAAIATCGKQKGVVSIIGTGCNTGYFNGKKITNNSAGLGYILGDEGSGAYLGKKVLQHHLNNVFDEELQAIFAATYPLTRNEILDAVYKQPLPNSFIASFSQFLSNNRGHFMIENIIEDGLHDLLYHHIFKISQSWQYPISFVGSVAFAFKDVLQKLCIENKLVFNKAIKNPVDELNAYHLLQID
jgi:glucosamine kinase